MEGVEGLIPFVYRAIVQYRNGGQPAVRVSWFDESPSAGGYIRLPGDSGRFGAQEIQFLAASPTRSGTSAPPPAQFSLRRTTSRCHA